MADIAQDTSAVLQQELHFPCRLHLNPCIQFVCLFVFLQAVDKTGSGSCTLLEFRHMMRTFKIDLNEEEFFHLFSFYDKNMTGKISYNDFLRAHLEWTCFRIMCFVRCQKWELGEVLEKHTHVVKKKMKVLCSYAASSTLKCCI